MQNTNRRNRIRCTYGGYTPLAFRSHRPKVVKFYAPWVGGENERETHTHTHTERERERELRLRKDFIIIILVMAHRNGMSD